MYFIQNTALVLLLHQFIVNSLNIFDIDIGFNYLNIEINSIMPSLAPDKEIMTRWFPQELDHFNSKDKRKWQMKYYEGLRYWRENGSIYMFVGGEGPASPKWASSGIMYELAKETHGAMYITEHRYYGDSKPFKNLDVENMKYLSSRQALADLSKLIYYFKSLPMYKHSKVVVIGGSYAGNLAAWMKVLYPNIIDASIASSGPVLAKKDFYEYLEKVNDNYELYGKTGCLDMIKEKFKKYDSMLQSTEGIKQLKKDENICNECDMTIPINQQVFFLSKTSPFMSRSQYGNIKAIKTHCENLNDTNENINFNNEHLKFNNSVKEQCQSYDFNLMINDLQETRNVNNIYAWLYQTCTEFGYYQTTNSKKQPFLNIPLVFFIRICSSLFGNNFNEKRVDEGVKISNKLYGGLNPNVTNVVFTNGDMDPWSRISILQDLSYDVPAIVIPRASHCRDLFPDKPGDSEELKEARKYVKYLIKKWIGEGEYVN